jgi:hypothetical protein
MGQRIGPKPRRANAPSACFRLLFDCWNG